MSPCTCTGEGAGATEGVKYLYYKILKVSVLRDVQDIQDIQDAYLMRYSRYPSYETGFHSDASGTLYLRSL